MITGIDHTGISIGFLCHDGQGNFLFHKRSQNCRDEQGRWDWGGGKLEFGETIQEALKRELKEEYGCQPVSIDETLPPVDWFPIIGRKKGHWIVLVSIVKVDPAQVKNNEPRSIDEIGWFRLDKLPRPLHTGVSSELKKYFKIIEKYSK